MLAVSKFPYVLGFGSDSVEIRLYINGTVVKNMDVRNVQLLSSKVGITSTCSTIVLVFYGLEIKSELYDSLSIYLCGSTMWWVSCPTIKFLFGMQTRQEQTHTDIHAGTQLKIDTVQSRKIEEPVQHNDQLQLVKIIAMPLQSPSSSCQEAQAHKSSV